MDDCILCERRATGRRFTGIEKETGDAQTEREARASSATKVVESPHIFGQPTLTNGNTTSVLWDRPIERKRKSPTSHICHGSLKSWDLQNSQSFISFCAISIPNVLAVD
jgi:hypothetical protein